MHILIKLLFSSLKYGTPFLLGTTGEIITEKSGSLNLGVEGLFAMGAFVGYYTAYVTGSLFAALAAAFAIGILGGLIFAFLTVTLQANQNVTGLALTIFGGGFYSFFGIDFIKKAGANPRLSDKVLAAVADKGISGLKEIPVIGPILFGQSILFYIAVIVALISLIYIKKTRFGLKMRAIGENPGAADAVGVRVNLIKYLNILIGSGICALGGTCIALVNGGGTWGTALIIGQGWIAVALVIFAKWNPGVAILGSFLFGLLCKLGDYATSIALEYSWLSFLTSIPKAIYFMLPFLMTAVVLIISSLNKKKKNDQPACCGINYYREDR